MTGKESSVNMQSANPIDFSRWLSGIPYEVGFWTSYYHNKSRFRDLMEWSMYGKETSLECFDAGEYLGNLEHKPLIADVGCALSYMLSNKIAGQEYEIIYMDPLALHYNRILHDTHPELPPITFGMGETLSLHFEPSTVDLIHIRNSLDHGAFPLLTIWQALIALRVGGVLYLNHKPNEAEAEGYRGFHQFNIDSIDGRMILWNKQNRFDVGTLIGDYAEIRTEKTQEGRIVSVIRKLKEIPSTHPAVAEGKNFYTEFTQAILTYFHSAPKSLDYQWKRIFTTIGHKTMRLLPYSLLTKIKRLTAHK